MARLELKNVEDVIIKTVDEIKEKLKIEANVTGECSPVAIGISSQILLTVMNRIGLTLGITIPDNCYIFHDKATYKQLTINEAAQKLLKVAKYGN